MYRAFAFVVFRILSVTCSLTRALSQSIAHVQQLFSVSTPGQILAPRVCTLVLFILHCLLQCLPRFLVGPLKSMRIPSFVLISFCFSELYAHLGPYRNVWPEAVYCFTITTLFTINLSLFHGHYGYLSAVCKVSFLHSVRFLRYASEN